jgi:hypothetical protein
MRHGAWTSTGAAGTVSAVDVAEERHGQGSSASTRYSMTWSACNSNVGGIVSPSALAVFRLMT